MQLPEVEAQMNELKDEYMQLQNNLEKLESIGGGNTQPMEARLKEIEAELTELYKKRAELRGY
ncbi:hypothetical protein FLK61_38770 [Paenalkalicoccus suaedae]|uniref:Uncharacterized protein n=1 Tax=Paenalkalicoccus suaedae TaxID=2592382 RepID=A0A859FIJ4_9BACI|nr:SE1832 family protein [Paenalkalicoccus suaedae]QKS72564.1 hypothetical protein FLK61_38770 [Paenalkalicoccus suaedae]